MYFCRSQIKKLESEQEELQKDLKLIESSSNQARNEKACESLGELGRKKRTYPTLFDVSVSFSKFFRNLLLYGTDICIIYLVIYLVRPHQEEM